MQSHFIFLHLLEILESANSVYYCELECCIYDIAQPLKCTYFLMSWIGIASAFHEEATYISTLCNGHTDTLQIMKFREGNNGSRR
jgi:hypothetical protein